MNDAALLISTHAREVWTRDEKRIIDRAAKLFNQRGMIMLLRCASPVCPAPAIAIHHDDTHPGGRVLRCGCTDRTFLPGLPQPLRRH